MSGQVVFDENYFQREKDENKLWKYIERGSHLILLSPRRVGKTSMLRHLERNPREGYVFLYAMVQSCNSEHEMYKQILEALYESDFVSNLAKTVNNALNIAKGALNKIEGITIADTGIKLSKSKPSLTYRDLEKAIKELNLQQKLVIVLDEYPDVLEKLNNNEGIEAARQLLSNIRTLTQSISFTNNAQLIITGSIGLDTLTTKLGLSNLTNDTDKLELSELTRNEAIEFINFIIQKNNSEMTLSTEVAEYLLQKVEWLMPYYIEILWERLDDLDINTPEKSDIDAAFETMFNRTYRKNFNHWVERLNRFSIPENKFAKEILTIISNNGDISYSELINTSRSTDHQSVNAEYVIDCLEHDGYIFEDKPDTYKFTTPILKEWWNRYAHRTI